MSNHDGKFLVFQNENPYFRSLSKPRSRGLIQSPGPEVAARVQQVLHTDAKHFEFSSQTYSGEFFTALWPVPEAAWMIAEGLQAVARNLPPRP